MYILYILDSKRNLVCEEEHRNITDFLIGKILANGNVTRDVILVDKDSGERIIYMKRGCIVTPSYSSRTGGAYYGR